ncbi:NAD(P)/FAD-dependent oxidoreductase [Brevibacillus sp. SYP-B805]|uniref:NAD(P)/FAD-dependent oxidoreductase n=1 Tax=Brevibacillus sp. SYP-B805 TaxID=1578199 RepID=UPI0013EBE633|nr:NAD(P)/FAD-dependent oxidoreductase [Brevibacillus sp. SYP-B805]NGQ94610.1 NAD(P)/FAD-dependent oxidoreductase [Brevibacillus sp. SYP-B805]
MHFDTVVVGGGIAGLQAAIQLGRSLRTVLVVDDGEGRSLIARRYRNLLGYPEGTSGRQLRAAGEEQAKRLGVRFLAAKATDLRQNEQGMFLVDVTATETPIEAKTIVLATGISDLFPGIPGLHDCLGETLFICPDCDGYETVNRRTVVIGAGPQAAGLALVLRYFTDRLAVINHTDEPVSPKVAARLEESGIDMVAAAVKRIEHRDGHLRAVHLENGEMLAAERGFVAFPGAVVNTRLLHRFPVEMLPNGHVLVNPRTKETSYRNIWAVGDIVAHSQMVAIAMGDGVQAAVWIHKRLLEEASSPVRIPAMPRA